MSALLANGADVNETTNGGQTALILAVIFGHTNVVRMLMNAGANPQLRDNLGLNAIEWAQRRGLNEAYAILTTRPDPSTRPRRIVIPVEETEKPVVEAPPAPRNDEVKSPGSEEKSKRWVDGVKQRLDEQAMRRLNRNEPTPEQRAVREDPPPPPVEPAKSVKRKRCPECNEIYNADLVAYCSQHMVPLVDLDSPIVAEAPKQKNGPLFWILLAVTLAGSLVMGSLITTYVYKANQAAAPPAAEPQARIQKGTPEVSTELAGKAVSLPEAECPMRGAEIMSGTVTVRILVDKSGQVNWARGSGGDWLMRGCSTEAAMKATFDAQKLRNRETEGTITYTFKP